MGVTGLMLLIGAVTTIAFVTGRFSANKETYHQQQIVQQTNNDDNNISVSRELVAWLDAAKFFDQLGMPERAEFSYKQASQLIPLDISKEKLAGNGQNMELAQILNNYDKQNLRNSEDEQKSNPEILINKILAKNFGE